MFFFCLSQKCCTRRVLAIKSFGLCKLNCQHSVNENLFKSAYLLVWRYVILHIHFCINFTISSAFCLWKFLYLCPLTMPETLLIKNNQNIFFNLVVTGGEKKKSFEKIILLLSCLVFYNFLIDFQIEVCLWKKPLSS